MILKASKRLRKFFNKDLTNEMIWQEIITEGRLNNIHQLTQLNAAAAHTLVKNEKRMQLLSLGITELSPEVARELAQYKGDKLYLNCAADLSPDSAKAIAQFKGAKLAFNGLKSLSIPLLGKFAPFRGALYLDGVETIAIDEKDTTRAETVFKNLEFARLSLTGLHTLSLHLLRALSAFRGELELSGLVSLSAEESALLGEHRGPGLYLKGINVLAEPLSRLLSNYKGVLDLSGAWEIEDALLEIAASRPPGNSLFSTDVKIKVDNHKQKIRQQREKHSAEKWQKEITKEEEFNKTAQKDEMLLAEFEKFDETELKPIIPLAQPLLLDEIDEFETEIDPRVLDDIEVNLNIKINQKRKQANALIARGFSRLSPDEKQELQDLRADIDELKEKIRKALDILVERKELGAVVFDCSADLAAYLNASGAEDDENNALDNIEKADWFSDSFETAPTATEINHQPVIEGDDFIFKEL